MRSEARFNLPVYEVKRSPRKAVKRVRAKGVPSAQTQNEGNDWAGKEHYTGHSARCRDIRTESLARAKHIYVLYSMEQDGGL